MLFILLILNDGDESKFTRIYKRYHNPLMHYAVSILHNQRLAEDAVQNAFIKVLKYLDKLSEDEHIKTWNYLVIAVKHASFTVYKHESFSEYKDLGDGGVDVLESDIEPVWSEYQAKELYQKIKDYINEKLSEIDRQIMILRTKSLSYKEIADITGISEGNVSVRLARIRKKMKDDLIREGVVL